jgi:hypothetical protein
VAYKIHPELARRRARIAGLTARGADPELIERARIDLAETKAAVHADRDYVEEILSQAGPLTIEAKRLLAIALSPSTTDALTALGIKPDHEAATAA